MNITETKINIHNLPIYELYNPNKLFGYWEEQIFSFDST